jgi:hypothetical protein
MNARQKAKYYKRKYEELQGEPYRPMLEVRNIYTETLKVAKFYPDCLFVDNPSLIKHELTLALSDEIEKYVHLETRQYEGFPSGRSIEGSITIAIDM